MRILIYTHSWYPFVSGITFRYKQIIDVLKYDHHIVLLTPYNSPEYDGITTIKIHSSEIPSCFLEHECHIGDSLQHITIVNTIYNTCIENEIDIVHGAGQDPMQMILKSICQLLTLPFVCMLHTNITSYSNIFKGVPGSMFTSPYLVNTIYPADIVILPSNAYYRDLIHNGLLNRDQPHYIMRLCVDHSTFYRSQPIKVDKWTSKKTRLLYVGRVEIEKSIDIILQSMDESMSLCIVGEGGDME